MEWNHSLAGLSASSTRWAPTTASIPSWAMAASVLATSTPLVRSTSTPATNRSNTEPIRSGSAPICSRAMSSMERWLLSPLLVRAS